MATCELLSGGIAASCDTNVGGIKKMWIANKENVTSYTYASPGGQISGITMASPSDFYEFVFNRNTSSYTESMASDPATGVELNTQTITLVLNRREQAKRDVLTLLGQFRELVIIIKDSNNIYKVFGQDGGCLLQTNEGGSGVVKTDPNRYTVTFVGEEPYLAYDIDEAAVLASIA